MPRPLFDQNERSGFIGVRAQALAAGQKEEALRPSLSTAHPSSQPAREKAKPTKKGGISAACSQSRGVSAKLLCASRYQSMQLVKPATQLIQAARELRLPKRTRAT